MRRLSVRIMAIFGLAIGCSESGDVPFRVDAGEAVTVAEGALVELSGTVTGGDVETMVFNWSQVDGPIVELGQTDQLTVDFRAPNISQSEEIVLRFTVSDQNNPARSSTVTVSIEDTQRRTRSPQGIDEDGKRRRRDAKNRRDTNRRMREGREVRSYDGTNNNLTHTNWGATFEHLQRLGAVDYADGISDLAGPDRPSARAVSNGVADQVEGVSIPNTVSATDFVWQWGQFIDHDLDLTDGAEESADIPVPVGDPFFDPTSSGGQFITFNRALFDSATGTDVANPREQENEITSWIDGSMVYGSDDERNAALRESSTPFLKTSAGNLLPFNTDELTNANGAITDPAALFLAGDIRANEQLGLTVMHTLFVREHNRIAQRILDNNPGIDADAVYERARRQVIGKIQIITYDEWLPVLLGASAIPPYAGYDDSVNPTIFNEFSVAAFRLGHSMLNEQLWRLDASGAEIAGGHIDLKDAFFAGPSVLTNEADLDPILRGFATQLHQELDAKVIDDIRNFLFGQPGAGGFDLASLNIQRGRDHGVPGYNDMREAMGLARYTQFGQITSDPDLADALFDTYGDVNAIDLWVGGLSEDPVTGSQVGELFQSILVKQFTDVRDGDRFWWENDLSSSERDRIRGSTLADIIRNNTNIGSELQDNVFVVP